MKKSPYFTSQPKIITCPACLTAQLNSMYLCPMKNLNVYFPELTNFQLELFGKAAELYQYWNTKVNLISRKDVEFLYEHHFLHSLSIACFYRFKPGTTVLDAGTGGGFPGIPLAIFFPEVQFFLADSIAKKIKVAQSIAEHLGLKNVEVINSRIENIGHKYDFAVGRALSNLPEIFNWLKDRLKTRGTNDFPNGIIYLKGGDFDEELRTISWNWKINQLSEVFPEPWFETKKIIHLYPPEN